MRDLFQAAPTPGVLGVFGHLDATVDAIQKLRAAGHTVHTPDLFDGRTFKSIPEGMAFISVNDDDKGGVLPHARALHGFRDRLRGAPRLSPCVQARPGGPRKNIAAP